MIHVTIAMAEQITSEALRWYASMLSSGRTEFTAADFPGLTDRALRRYVDQLRRGWADIRVIRRAQGDQPTVYGLPADTPAPSASSSQERADADAFASSWSSRPESSAAPCSAADYQVLRVLAPADTTTETFNRALTSKLLELAQSDLAHHARPGLRLAWLRTGLLRLLSSMPAAASHASASSTAPAAPAYDPMQLTPLEEEINRQACERMKDWKPPPIDPSLPPLHRPVEWNADVPPEMRLEVRLKRQ